MKSHSLIPQATPLGFLLFLCLIASWLGEAAADAGDVAPMEAAEREALYSAIQGFVGSWWNGSDLYPDPCGWTPVQGVSCDLFDGLWYVTDLNIGPVHENSLVCSSRPSFTPHVFQLRHLKSLSFFACFASPSQNPITVPPERWESLAGSLESLEFRSNPGLVGQLPSSFGQLAQLQSLVILENGLSGYIPQFTGNLSKLKRLVLAGNSFTGPVPDSFGGLSELLILDLSSNSLSGPLTSSALGGLTSLLKLDLSNNRLEGKLPAELGNLKNLTLLDLRNNKLTGGLTNSIQEMHSLEELILANNPLGGDLVTLDWRNLQGMVILDLSQTGLTGAIPKSISQLKRLRFLGLANNNLTGNISPELETLPCLNALYLNGNNFTGELKFSVWFYGKMERRFGAWDNPNLCYPVESMSTGQHHQYVQPFGVRPCQHHQADDMAMEPNSKNQLVGDHGGNGDDGEMEHINAYSISSLGSSSHGGSGVCCPILVEILVIMQLLLLLLLLL